MFGDVVGGNMEEEQIDEPNGVKGEETQCLHGENDTTKHQYDVTTFEDVLMKVGTFGKYQFVQCALCLSPMLLLTFMSLGFVIIGFTPPHVCNPVNKTKILTTYGLHNDSSAHLRYGQCELTLTSNRSGQQIEITALSCPDGRDFPKGKYMTIVSEWDLVCEKTGRPELAQLMYTIGNIIGGLVVPLIADRFGRKLVICVASIINMLLELSITFAPNMYFVCAVLFFDGISYSGIGSVYLVLGMEILTSKYRQIFGVVACQYWVFCVLVVGCVGYFSENIGWRYFQGIGALSGLMTLTMPFFLCESPRWLAINERSDEALAILEKACKQNGNDVSEIKKVFANYMNSLCHKNQKKNIIRKYAKVSNCNDVDSDLNTARKPEKMKVQKYTLLNMFTKKETLILLLITWYLWTTSNLTYYGIFMSSSNLAGNRFLNFGLLALVEVPANFLVLYMLNRMARLRVLRIFLSLAALSLMLSLSLSTFADSFKSSGMLSTIFLIFGKFAITSTFNAVYIITPELFPTVLRSSGNGSCKSIPKIGSMLAPFSRPLYTVAKWAPSLIFASMCFIALLLTFFLPETKGRILPTRIIDITKRRKTLSHHETENVEL